MSNKKLTGEEQITPTLTYDETSGKPNGHLLGLTIREHFAAMMLQGIIAGNEYLRTGLREPNDMADRAVRLADALITELNK